MSAKKGTPNPLNAKHYLSTHPLYRLWASIKNRCYNPNELSYKDYGARGVIMCEEWKTSPESFIKWCLTNGYEKGLQIDKDIKGTGFLYSPGCCIFVTRSENCNHRRTNRIIEYDGQRKTIQEWSKITGIKHFTLSMRLKHGYSIQQALTTPNGKRLPGRRPQKYRK